MKLTTFCLIAFSLLLISFAFLGRAQEVDDEREFSYAEDSEVGPARWGEIHPEWRKCGVGRMQSPIDLLNERVEIVSHLGGLKRHYKPSNATLVNRGHDMMLRWNDDAGHILIHGTMYQLRQCHWHSPSEHTLNGRMFDMEVHLVHQSNDNRTAVIGIMYKIGRPDSFLQKMNGYLNALAKTGDAEIGVGIIDPGLIKFGSRKYYRYIGSLTTPPCTENITWTILRKVRTVSRKQVALIRDAVDDDAQANARPIQPLKNRHVELYKPKNHEN